MYPCVGKERYKTAHEEHCNNTLP